MNGFTNDGSPPPPDRRGGRARRLTHNLRVSQSDAAAFGVMVGLGETYLPLFALTIGLGEVMSGLVVSVPVLIGSIIQMISPWAVRALRSHKRWVLCCALLQAASFVPLITAALIGRMPGWAALGVAAIYWAGNLGTGPAWNVWIGTLVPRPIRAHFFARRTRLQQFTVLSGFLIGGFSLEWGKQYDRALLVFAGLFVIACVCRILSASFLASQDEPQPLPDNMRRVPALEQLRGYRHSPGGRLLLYIVCVQFGVWISGAYFAPYMREKLKFSYVDYSVLIAFSFVFKIMALPLCGRFAKRFGPRRLLTLGGIGIIPLSGMWSVSDNYVWLCFTQVTAGLMWAAYELAFLLLFFESLPADERVSVLTFYNLLNSAALAAGALVGGMILHFANEANWAYHVLFLTSSAWRLTSLVLLHRVPQINVAAAASIQIEDIHPAGENLEIPLMSSLAGETEAPPISKDTLAES